MRVGGLGEVTVTGLPQVAVLGPRVLVKLGAGLLAAAREISTSDARLLAAALLEAVKQAEAGGRV